MTKAAARAAKQFEALEKRGQARCYTSREPDLWRPHRERQRALRAYRNRKLSEAQKAANTTRSKVRARVEHVFGDQKNAIGAEIVRTIGIVRARCKIGMTNLVYNMRRFIILERMAEVAR